MSYDNQLKNFTMDNIDKFINIDQQIFMNLIDIPPEFARLKRIRDISQLIIDNNQQGFEWSIRGSV
jgi:hypothetical protein